MIMTTHSKNIRRSMLAVRMHELEGKQRVEFKPYGISSALPIFKKKRNLKDLAIGLCDLSPLTRLGLKGKDLLPTLTQAGIIIPKTVNSSTEQKNGSLCLRLAVGEVLLLSALNSNAKQDFKSLHQTLNASKTSKARKCWTAPYQDSLCWLALVGEEVPTMLAKLCAVDLRTRVFAINAVAQTSLARLSAIIVRAPHKRVSNSSLFYILCDNASSLYLWDCICDAMGEFQGKIVSRDELLTLV